MKPRLMDDLRIVHQGKLFKLYKIKGPPNHKRKRALGAYSIWMKHGDKYIPVGHAKAASRLSAFNLWIKTYSL